MLLPSSAEIAGKRGVVMGANAKYPLRPLLSNDSQFNLNLNPLSLVGIFYSAHVFMLEKPTCCLLYWPPIGCQKSCAAY